MQQLIFLKILKYLVWSVILVALLYSVLYYYNNTKNDELGSVFTNLYSFGFASMYWAGAI